MKPLSNESAGKKGIEIVYKDAFSGFAVPVNCRLSAIPTLLIKVRGILFLIFFSFFFCTYSQSLRIEPGPVLGSQAGGIITDIVARDKEGFYVLRHQVRSSAEPFLDRYDRKMNLVFSRPLQGSSALLLQFEKILFTKGQFFVFTSYYNKDEDRNIAFVHIADLNGQIISPPCGVDTINAEKRRNSGKFYFSFSDDSTKILVSHDDPYNRLEGESFSFKVLNLKLEVIRSKSVKLLYPDDKFTIIDYKVDRFANVFVLGKLSAERVSQKDIYSYTLLAYYLENNSFCEYIIALDDKIITEMILGISAEGDVIAAGLYAYSSTPELMGLVYLCIHPGTNEVVSRGASDLPPEFLSSLSLKRYFSSRGKPLLRHLLFRRDGGIFLAGEKQYVEEVTLYDPRTGRSRTTYFYRFDEILLVSVNREAAIEWAVTVPKLQQSTNDGGYYLSYSLAYSDSTVYFFFNDHPSNRIVKNRKAMRTMTRAGSSELVSVRIDKKGRMEKKILLSSREYDMIMVPGFGLPVPLQDVIFYFAKGQKYRFARLYPGGNT